MKRPLLRVALLYVGGILAAELISLSLVLLFASCLALIVLAIVCARARSALLYPLIFLTGCTAYTLHTGVLSPLDLRRVLGTEPELLTVRGVLIETPTLRVYEQAEKASWRTLARLEVTGLCRDKGQWAAATGQIAVTTPAPLTNLFAGQRVEVFGVAARPRPAVAEGTFDYRYYLKQQGIYYHLQAGSQEDWRLISSPPKPPLADRFRTWARQALARGLPVEDESVRLEWALTLGWKPALTEEVSEPFVQAATYHIFAVDGLRMAIIFAIFFGLFRALGLPRWICGLALTPLIWFYVALTGWPASAIRATVMLTVVIVGWTLKRPSDLINSLLAAALLILIWEPQQIFQAGFQLSFCVVLCMILMLPVLNAAKERLTAHDPFIPAYLHRRWPPAISVPAHYTTELLLTSFAAWVGSIPLVAYYFNIVTPVSTPANLVAVPLCGLVLASNLATLLLSGWFPFAAELFNHAGWFIMECIRISSHWFAAWPKAYFYVPAPSLFTSGLYYGLLIALLTGWLLKPRLRWLKWAGAGAAMLLWSCALWHQWSCSRLTVLPVNGGTALYFDARGRSRDVLIDSGNTNAVQFIMKPFLRAQGVNRLPVLLLTHGDVQHVGGAQPLVSLFKTDQVFASPLRFRSTVYRKILKCFSETPGRLRTIGRSDNVADWKVLHPDPSDRFPRADDGALVLSGTVRGTRLLLLSDLGSAGQDALLKRGSDLRADILIAGLPSSSECLCDALLDAIRPHVIIISDAEFPVSERANSRLRERLARRQSGVLYTRFCGAATIELRPGKWEIRTMNGTKLRGRATARGTQL